MEYDCLHIMYPPVILRCIISPMEVPPVCFSVQTIFYTPGLPFSIVENIIRYQDKSKKRLCRHQTDMALTM